jgi:putative selenate reductase FAD-binding subunit
MITQYFRPGNLQEALDLISMPNAFPLAGGTLVNTPEFEQIFSITVYPSGISLVDLQALGLVHIRKLGNALEIDACVTLQQLLENQHTPEAIKNALRLEAAINIRNAATVAGTLVACDGRSPFATVMLAIDSELTMQPQDQKITLGNFLPQRSSFLHKKLITCVTIPLNPNVSFEYTARSPADRPIVCASAAQWASGRTRLALGGYGSLPLLALDGTNVDDIQASARNAFHEAADEWASADFRADVAAILSERCVKN